MIWLAFVAVVAVMAGFSWLILRVLLGHMRHLGDQNQMLTAALMATKNSPYASNAASIVERSAEQDMHVEIPVHDDAPEGTRLLGT